MSQFEEVTIGECRLILGDCREVLPLLPPFDLVLTDPPYGIGYIASTPNAVKHGAITGDEELMDLRFLFSAGECVVTWGANFYPE